MGREQKRLSMGLWGHESWDANGLLLVALESSSGFRSEAAAWQRELRIFLVLGVMEKNSQACFSSHVHMFGTAT